jgi:Ca2+-transporting ATPase
LHDSRTDENPEKKGLTSAEVLDRLRTFGSNKLPEKKGRTASAIYASQFRNPLIYIITAAAIIAFALEKYSDALIIAIVILVDSIVGFFQEYRAEKAVIALRRLLKPTAKVIRDGRTIEMGISGIVPDDIVAIIDGDKVGADGTLIESVNLHMNEAILTGESESVGKNPGDMVYMGTIVLSGRGLMKVKSTGASTELGKIAGSLAEMKDEATPLQIRLGQFGKSLTYLVIGLSIVIFIVGLLSDVPPLQMVMMAVVLAIAAIPEGLPIAVTMILVIGMHSILRRQGLVKKLLAVETLGSVTTICTDKTGTLTEGNMQVVRTDFRSEEMAYYAMTLCNNLSDSLDVTLWNKVKEDGKNPEALSERFRRVYEVPFSSEKKYMLTINNVEGASIALVKGAPEVILEFCALLPNEKEMLANQFMEWTLSGLKVLGLAYKKKGTLSDLRDFEWLGLVGMQDPVRPDVKDAVAQCHSAGIKVKMVTGDHKGTAQKVASAIGLHVKLNQILEGKDLETMTESELAKVVNDVVIFSRVAPHQKVKIVDALQKRREVTAMIGDGVNDAPALKKANIGVSVGNATDVAQETASLILLNNSFKTLVSTVEEGRIIFDNIRKVVAYVLSNSFAEILTIFGAMLMRWPPPLSVAQLLWIHLICDGPSDIVLGFERGEVGIMDEKPRSVKESILDSWGRTLILVISTVSAAICLFLFWYFWQVYGDPRSGSTIVFTVLAIQELVYIFGYRNLRHPIFKSGNFFKNKALFATVAFGFFEQSIALYISFLNNALGVVPLHLNDWTIVLVVAFGMLFTVEVVKYMVGYSQRRDKTKHQDQLHETISIRP